MDAQGAGFAFDPVMDFGFMKPIENDASGFFGDEGIDTTTSFIDPLMLATPQESTYMPQNLVSRPHPLSAEHTD